MEYAFPQFQENHWVSALAPAFLRHHRLAIVDATFAHTYCGKIFYLNDITLIEDHEANNKCPRCAVIE